MKNDNETLTTLLLDYRRSPSLETETALWTALMDWAKEQARYRARSLRIDPEDLCSEFITAIVTALPQAPNENLAKWLQTVITNKSASIARQNRRQPRTVTMDLADEPDTAATAALISKIDYEGLTPAMKAVADLILEGYSIREIATKLNVPSAALRKRLQRLRDDK